MRIQIQCLVSFIIFLVSYVSEIHCQTIVEPSTKEYNAWVKHLIQEEPEHKFLLQRGFLTELNKDQLIIGNIMGNDLQMIAAENIEFIKVREKGKVLKGMGYGALIGVGVGTIVGLATGSENNGCCTINSETQVLASAIFLGAIGAVVGGIVNAPKITIPINRDINNYREQKAELEKYLLNQ